MEDRSTRQERNGKMELARKLECNLSVNITRGERGKIGIDRKIEQKVFAK